MPKKNASVGMRFCERWAYSVFLLTNMALVFGFYRRGQLTEWTALVLHFGNVMLLTGLELYIPLNEKWLFYRRKIHPLTPRPLEAKNDDKTDDNEEKSGMQWPLFLKTFLWYLFDSRVWFWVHAFSIYGAALWLKTSFTTLQHFNPAENLSWIFQVGLLALVVDGLRYGIHRAAHAHSFLWRWHAMHHTPTHMTPVRAWWTHPVDDVMLYGPEIFVFVLLGFDKAAILAFLSVDNFFQLLNHANCKMHSGFLGAVFQHPRYHLLHHRLHLPTRGTVNFGEMFTLWDRLFGTFDKTDLRDMQALEIGILPRQKRTLLEQLCAPFRAE